MSSQGPWDRFFCYYCIVFYSLLYLHWTELNISVLFTHIWLYFCIQNKHFFGLSLGLLIFLGSKRLFKFACPLVSHRQADRFSLTHHEVLNVYSIYLYCLWTVWLCYICMFVWKIIDQWHCTVCTRSPDPVYIVSYYSLFQKPDWDLNIFWKTDPVRFKTTGSGSAALV